MASTTSTINIRDINPLGHLTSDIARSQYNYESALNAIIEWNNSKMPTVTLRLSTDTDPYYVDYTFPTKYASASSTGNVISQVGLGSDAFAYGNMLSLSALTDTTSGGSDKVNVRMNVTDTGATRWELWELCTVYDEVRVETTYDDTTGAEITKYAYSTAASRDYVSGCYIRACIPGYNNGKPALFRTLNSIKRGSAFYTENTSGETAAYTLHNIYDVVVPWTKNLRLSDCNGKGSNGEGNKGYFRLADYQHVTYIATGDTNASQFPDVNTSGWSVYAHEYEDNTWYQYGSLVEKNNEFFICIAEGGIDSVAPYDEPRDETSIALGDEKRTYNEEYWRQVFLKPVPDAPEFSSSTVFRHEVETDIQGYILKNVGDDASGDETMITVLANIAVTAAESVAHRGMQVFDTCNYSRWPSTGAKWQSNVSYGPTDSSKSVYELQDYTAVMIFNHSDISVKKLNIINYDGPDLDQGLAIFLPRTVTTVDDSGVEKEHDPEDGYMIEFMFRIWPHPELNDKTTNDLIINKSQIYVYHSDDDSIDINGKFDSTKVFPIAKFSMARLTNFYVFSENIGVPNRPVLYKARFIYSRDDSMWRTYDYYQMPDHLFLSPNGFVDPQSASDDAYSGVETAGFPLFQDPFSGYDLRPLYDAGEISQRINDTYTGITGRVLGTEDDRYVVSDSKPTLIRVSKR